MGVLVVFAVVAAACQGTPSQSSTEPHRDELRIGLSTFGTEVLDPIFGPNDNGKYLWLMYDPLVGVDYKGESISKKTGIASDWNISPDGRTYTFTLRKGVKFHNGDDVTANDVKFSLERLSDPKVQTSQGARIARQIDTITVKGDYELEVRLKQPDSIFLLRLSPLADTSSFIVPKRYYNSVSADGFAQAPIGSGPYKLVERRTGASMTFEAAFGEHFAIGKPRFKRVIFRLIPEESTRVALFGTGELDFIDVGLDQGASLRDKADVKLVPHGLRDLVAIHFQLQREGEATADINVRKALSLAINREEINTFLMHGQGTITGNIFTGLDGGKPLAADGFNPGAAQEFLNQTPYRKGGKQLTIQIQAPIREGWPQMLSIAEAIQAAWTKIGVASKITYRDYGAYRTEWAAGTLPAPAAVVTNISGSPEYTGLAGGVFTCKGVVTSACDPEFDKLVAAWGSSASAEEYTKDAVQAEAFIHDNYWYIPILSAGILFAVNRQVPSQYTPGRVYRGINTRALVWDAS
jgi:peptide/nickel transport system substrate-binding protein